MKSLNYVYGKNPFYDRRIDERISKTKLCKAAGISWQTLTNIEKGKTLPSFDVLCRWLQFFNTDLSKVIRGY